MRRDGRVFSVLANPALNVTVIWKLTICPGASTDTSSSHQHDFLPAPAAAPASGHADVRDAARRIWAASSSDAAYVSSAPGACASSE